MEPIAASEAARPASPDRLLDGRLTFSQPAGGYRAAIDPVLLAAAAGELAPGTRALEAGCGAGAALLCLAWREPAAAITGLEIQPDLADLARANVAANGFQDRCTIVTGDLAAPAAGDQRDFDLVLANPPYVRAGQTAPPERGKAAAVQEGALDLEGWVAALARGLRPKGRLTLIHRADRLDRLTAAMSARGLGDVALLPLWPSAGRPAKRVIVTARKGVKGDARLAPGLVLHDADGAFTPLAATILRDGAAVPASAWGAG